MKILNYQAHNVLRISDIDFDLSGRHLFLVGGRNGQGKSSALIALLSALCGRSGMDWPDVLLKHGEDEGWVRVELSGDEGLQENENLVVELKLERRRDGSVLEKLRVLDSTGEYAPEPRTLLKQLYTMRAFDPLEFERMRPREQHDLLCRLVGIDLEEYEREYKKLYDERTEVNREGKAVKAHYDAMPEYPEAPEEEVDVASLMAELEAVRKANFARDKAELNVSSLEKEVDGIQQEIARLKKLSREKERALALAKSTFADLPDLNERESEITAQIKGAQAANNKVAANLAKAEKQTRLNDLREKSRVLSEDLENIVAKKEAMLAAAKWPVPGLGVDKEGVLFNGLPFGQSSKSERVFISSMIGIALNPKLRLLVCQGGSDLDSDTMSVLQSLLGKNDYQMILELVTRTKDDEEMCAVIIEEGRVRDVARDAGN